MDQELKDTLQLIIEKIGDMDSKINKMDSKIEDMESRMATKDDLKASEARTRLYIENNVSKKIEALFDGYKLTHEKQWELERRMDDLERTLENIQNRIA